MPSIVSVATWETGSRSCTTGWRWTARLLAVLSQSVPGIADGTSVCPVAGVAARGSRRGLCPSAGGHLPGAATPGGGVGRRSVRRIVLHLPRTLGHDLATSDRGHHGQGLVAAHYGRGWAKAMLNGEWSEPCYPLPQLNIHHSALSTQNFCEESFY